MNRLTTVTDPVGQTSYTYNALGNLTALKDAEQQTTQFEYDKNGRLKKEVRPMNEETLYDYDEAGNLIEKFDAKAQRTTYTYTDAGRLEQIAYHDGKTVTFTYDNAGNLKTYDDGETSGTYDYDALNRKISETVNYGAFSKTLTYDYYDNSLKKTFTMPDNTAYGYTYDNNNQLTSISLPGVGDITYPSYTWMRPDSVVFPGGSKREYSYDPLMRVKQILAKDPGQNIMLDYQYSYDKMGNILTKTTDQGTYNYTYDALYRLTDVEVDIPDVNDEAFTYDNVGNRKTEAGVDGEWNYNENNELLTFADVEYVYDENGNMTQKKVGTAAVNYMYNAADRLIKVEDDLTKTVIAEYYYDPFGRRLWKDIGGTRTYFFYSDEGLVAEYDASGNELKTYGYKPDSTWTTDPLFMKQGGEYYFYQNDRLGTPQKLVGVNGAVVWSAVYSAFGKADVQVETVTNNLRFPGQYYDAETGLHYNYFRYYDPKIGRYLTQDPIGIVGGVHLYGYANNNPLLYFDSYGLLVKGLISLIPIVGTAFSYFVPADGESVDDYSIDIDCYHGIPVPECRKSIQRQALFYLFQSVALWIAHEFIDVYLIGQTAGLLSHVLIIDMVVDFIITIDNMSSIQNAANQAASLCAPKCLEECCGTGADCRDAEYLGNTPTPIPTPTPTPLPESHYYG